MFHTNCNRWNNLETYEEIKIVQQTKVLGYILDQKLSNQAHIEYIQKKLQKIQKMIRISSL